jgi:hypothetical protein
MWELSTKFPNSYVLEKFDDRGLSICVMYILLMKMLDTVLEIISISNNRQIQYLRFCLSECS